MAHSFAKCAVQSGDRMTELPLRVFWEAKAHTGELPKECNFLFFFSEPTLFFEKRGFREGFS